MSIHEQRPADCFICRKHQGEVFVAGGTIYEEDLVYASHISQEGQPAYLGYLMVETRRHVQ